MTRSQPASTYDDDFFAWTQEQAAALRDMPRETVGAHVDIDHVAEEIEDLGKRDLREVTSHLGRLFEYLVKIASNPQSRDVAHWRAETRLFRRSASDAFTPSMRQLINLRSLWNRSRKAMAVDLADVGVKISVSEICPFTLDELLSDDFDVDAALFKLGASRAADRHP